MADGWVVFAYLVTYSVIAGYAGWLVHRWRRLPGGEE